MPGQRRFPYLGLKRLWRPAAAAAALAAVAFLAAQPATAADEHFTARAAITLQNGQKITAFDISWVDAARGGYFLADRTNASVWGIDVHTHQITQQLKGNFAGANPLGSDFSGPNGILTIGHFLWAGDFGTGTNGGVGGLLKVIDLDTGVLVKTIATGGTARADELCYDPKDHLVLIANDAEKLPPTGPGPYVSFVSTAGSNQYQIVGQIFLGGQQTVGGVVLKATNGIEQCQWDPRTKRFYIAIPELNGPGDDSGQGAVLEINATSMSVVRVFLLNHNECKGPQGMAIGPAPQILLGCNNPAPHEVPSTVIINERNGNTLAVLPNEDGSDQVWFNPGDGHYFLGESGGANPQHLGIVDALTANEDDFQLTGRAGGGGAHSVAADPNTLQVFVPIPSTAGAGACGTAGGDDSVGCILVYKANHPKREIEGE